MRSKRFAALADGVRKATANGYIKRYRLRKRQVRPHSRLCFEERHLQTMGGERIARQTAPFAPCAVLTAGTGKIGIKRTRASERTSRAWRRLVFKQILNRTTKRFSEGTERFDLRFVDILIPLFVHLNRAERHAGKRGKFRLLELAGFA